MVESGQIDATDVKIVLNAIDKPYGGEHCGRLELSTTSEIGLLMHNSLESNQARNIVCTIKNQIDEEALHFIPDNHCSCDPLQYPCLFPHGTDG